MAVKISELTALAGADVADDDLLAIVDVSATETKRVVAEPFYRKTNIVGTVSETDDIPTGAIIERGSNANGEFVKFADGTMICVTESTFTFASPLRLRFTWTFPSEFSATPNGISTDPRGNEGATASGTRDLSSIGHIGTIGTPTETNNDFSMFRASGTSDFTSGNVWLVRLTAIGRWF
jgi:hypothetical protein